MTPAATATVTKACRQIAAFKAELSKLRRDVEAQRGPTSKYYLIPVLGTLNLRACELEQTLEKLAAAAVAEIEK